MILKDYWIFGHKKYHFFFTKPTCLPQKPAFGWLSSLKALENSKFKFSQNSLVQFFFCKCNVHVSYRNTPYSHTVHLHNGFVLESKENLYQSWAFITKSKSKLLIFPRLWFRYSYEHTKFYFDSKINALCHLIK